MAETEGATRAKHTPEEIRQNHLNAAKRSLLAAHKRVMRVRGVRDEVKARAATIDSEHTTAAAIYSGARERYRHAHLIATGSEPDSYPAPDGFETLSGDGLSMEADQVGGSKGDTDHDIDGTDEDENDF